MQKQKGNAVATKDLSIKDKIKQLRSEAEKLETQRAEELTGEITERIAELNDITGKTYQLTDIAQKPSSGKGRPKGFKMSDEQKQRMRDGRAKAKAERETQMSLTS